MVCEAASAEVGLQFYADRLHEMVKDLVQSILYNQPLLLGVYAVIRAPVMVVYPSPILRSNGEPCQSFRPESVLTSCVFANSHAGKRLILPEIAKQLQDALQRNS
jgi:hypothetical protein